MDRSIISYVSVLMKLCSSGTTGPSSALSPLSISFDLRERCDSSPKPGLWSWSSIRSCLCLPDLWKPSAKPKRKIQPPELNLDRLRHQNPPIQESYLTLMNIKLQNASLVFIPNVHKCFQCYKNLKVSWSEQRASLVLDQHPPGDKLRAEAETHPHKWGKYKKHYQIMTT